MPQEKFINFLKRASRIFQILCYIFLFFAFLYIVFDYEHPFFLSMLDFFSMLDFLSNSELFKFFRKWQWGFGGREVGAYTIFHPEW